MEILSPEKMTFRFSKYYKQTALLSLVLLVVSAVLLISPGVNYGIDFKGGIEAHVKFKEQPQISAIRETLDPKLKNLSVVGFSDSPKEFLITAQSDDESTLTSTLTSGLTEKFGSTESGAWEIMTMDIVGAKVVGDLLQAAILAVVYTCLIITIFMYWRFDLRFAPGALFCIFHDLLLVGGFLALSGIEFSTTIVAALLTLAGYSINDTVVVYDRIREIEGKFLGKTKTEVVDKAVNSTLSRTVMTTFTTLLSCAVLYFLGGVVLKDFAAVLFVGIVVGTYSSVYVAAPLYVRFDKIFGHKVAGESQTQGA